MMRRGSAKVIAAMGAGLSASIAAATGHEREPSPDDCVACGSEWGDSRCTNESCVMNRRRHWWNRGH